MSANAAASDIETGERQSTHHEASARTGSTSHTLFRTDTLRRAFISLCLVDLVRSFDCPRSGNGVIWECHPFSKSFAWTSSSYDSLCRSLS